MPYNTEKPRRSVLVLLTLALLCPLSAHAKSTIVFNGPMQGNQSASNIQISEDQKLIFEASNKFVALDYKAAEALYTKAMQVNNGNIQAYLGRGLVRREVGNVKGAQADANRALALIDARLRGGDNSADLYYDRSMCNRLLKQFDAAERDLTTAGRIQKRGDWDTSMKAIALERKMSQ